MNSNAKIESQSAAPNANRIVISSSERHKIPMAAKVAGTAFLGVLIPIYLRTYGPTNFLWFCDAALIITVAGMWLESSMLISMCAVGILLPQGLWILDFGVNFLGVHFTGLTSYMFDKKLSLFTRGLSLFHGWLPLLLVWLLTRLGYDKRALPAWSAVAAGLLAGSYFFSPPPGVVLSDPNIPDNVNYVYGLSENHPQTWLNPILYVALWFCAFWLVAYLPTHLALSRIFRASSPAAV